MDFNNDNITAVLGCGEKKFFTTTRAYNAWIKLHKKKCFICDSHKKEIFVNVNAADSVSKHYGSAKNNFMSIKQSIKEASIKGDRFA